MREETKKFLELLEAQNQAIFREQEAERAAKEAIKPDPVRLQRDEDRREKYGQLRARETPSNRPRRVRRLFGYSDLSSND